MNKKDIVKLFSLGCLSFAPILASSTAFAQISTDRNLTNQVSGQSAPGSRGQSSQVTAQMQNGQTVPLQNIPPGQTVYIRTQEGQLIPYKTAGELSEEPTEDIDIPPPPPLPNERQMTGDKELQRRAMDELFIERFGVTPEDIIRQRQEDQKRKRAAAQNPETPPKPVTRTVNVSLQPGSSPEIIRTYMNNSTSLVITDSTGTPWPVVNYSVGNGEGFDVQRLDSVESGGGSMFSISPNTDYAYSNLVLALKGKSTPVTLTLVAGQKEVDYRVNARVLALGPNANVSYSSMPQSSDTDLLTVLDGVPPENSRKLEVSGQMSNNTTVWLQNNDVMIVRTDLVIKTPIPMNGVSSPDGTSVYKFAPTSPMLAYKNGKYVNIKVSGW